MDNALIAMEDYLGYEGYGGYEQYGNEEMNPLENGPEYEDSEFMDRRMREFESGLLFIAVAVLFCVLVSCFVWRSKWGSLVRRLNERRLERNRKLYGSRFAMDSADSSSLIISDVSPINDRV